MSDLTTQRGPTAGGGSEFPTSDVGLGGAAAVPPPTTAARRGCVRPYPSARRSRTSPPRSLVQPSSTREGRRRSPTARLRFTHPLLWRVETRHYPGEVLLRARVPRPRMLQPSSHVSSHVGVAPANGSTARIERAHSDRARSASEEPLAGAPLSIDTPSTLLLLSADPVELITIPCVYP